MTSVLFINHSEQSCGVHQFFKRLVAIPLALSRYDCHYREADSLADFQRWHDQIKPAIVVYNFYTGATMPWLSPDVVRAHRAYHKQACIFHEVPLDSMGFDLILCQDPTEPARPGWVNLTRPIPTFSGQVSNPSLPTFGSFGFGLGGKGFTRLVDSVGAEYDRAVIRLNIPYAAFGDRYGRGAQDWAAACRQLAKPGIELVITHDLLPQDELLQWLSEHTANCFLYDINYGRGISGTLDYALAAGKPIAITQSWQFKHIWTIDDSMCVEHHSIRDIVAMGTDRLQPFREMWSDYNLTECFDNAFDQLIGG